MAPESAGMNLNKTTQELPANTTLSHYRILSRIGAGGMGEVWLAEDTRLDRKVALKLLPAEFTQDADRVRRFMQEAKAASALNHPNIITVYDIGECEAGRFIVMELVSGRTLSKIIREESSTAEDAEGAGASRRLGTLLALASQMARALSAAHGAGITHRDIKPDNIMVRDDGYVKVLDFGLARLLPSGAEDAATVAQQTTPGMIMGTVAYMSPEQARGQSASPRSDVFALGIVLYELATGQHPFSAETLVGYLHAITLQTPPPPSRLRPGIPAALDGLILRMLRKDASQRPAAVEVAQAFQELERRGDTTKLTYVESETVLLPTAHAGTTSADEGFWVAVLPFKWRGANADLEALAEGLTEDVVTGLSRFSYLRVIARSTTLRYASHSSDVRAIGKEVGARYVMEGNLRQAGPILRVAVQLVDAETGAHLWAEAYDRPYSAEQIFSLQDDLVPRIVSTVADSYGILPHSMSQVVRSKPAEQLTPYEALLRSFSYVERVTSEEHASARAALECAVEQAPGDSDSWAMLSILHTDEHIHGFSARTGLLEQALQFARRAVDANPLNHRAHQALAWALCYRKEFDACKHAAERTVALNPMDASALAHVGQTIAYGGGWERGCELLNRAMQLNPHYPGWYRYALFLNAYRQADYSGALEIALKMSMPGVSLMYVALAAVYGQLSKLEAAREAIRELLVLRPNFKTDARTELEKLWDRELVDRLIEGLNKAGLETVEAERLTARTLAIEPGRKNQSAIQHTASSALAIVVLPFTNTSADEENEYFCDGLTEELITDLSKIRSLRVISRNSAMRLKATTKDLRTIVEELNVRYVLDGSVRKVGQSLRISVQLIDGVTDANLWSDKYNGTLEDIFEMQENVSRSIAEALEITLTDDEQRRIEERPIGNAQAYDLYLRARANFLLGIPSALDRSIELLKQGLDIIGENELLYAALGYTYYFYFRWISKLDEGHLRLANECTKKVFAINPSSSHGFSLKGLLCYSEGDIGESIRFLKKAVELEPTNTEALLWLAANNSYINHREEGMKYADKVRALDPLLPINTLIKGVVYLYDGQFNASLLWAERSLAMEPANLLLIWSVAIIKAWCGKIDEAITHIDTLAQIAPDWVYTQHGLFLKHGLRGEKDLALRYDTAELETEAQHDCHFGLHVAHCFALVGMNDRALDFLERAVRTGMVNSRFLGELDPFLENIRHEQRFKDLMLEAQRLFEQIGDTKENLESSQDNLVRKPAPGAKEQRPSETSPTSNSSFEEGFWVAVLPFKCRGANADLEALAEGLSEEIITGLSRFSYLRVVARSSTLRFTSEASDIRTIGIALGARYVMEGSVRQAGETARLAVQLVDATNGAHLWAETFDRRFQPNQIFAMQDELVPRIVSTCGDHFGVLARSISDAVRWKDPSQLSPYEALMRGFGYHHRLTASEHAGAREVLEQAVEQAPGNADCWAMLSWIYSHEYGHGFNQQPGSLDRALDAARRAVDLAPSNHLAYQTLAVALFFRKDKAGCLSAAERAMALNPLDASNEAIFLITFTGDWDRGCALIAGAMELNPHHPGWYRWVLGVNEYRQANYREAVDAAVKANVPGIFWTNMLLAAAYGQLGELEAGRDAVRILLAQKEDFVDWARETLGKWFEPELVEHLAEGLRKAGLEVDASLANSGSVRADEGFWVAVLPFKYTGANAGVTALAEGLTEDITTGLSRFSYLRVIARGSTLLYANQTSDLRALGKELGARYMMEGSLRQAGTQLRIAVQLVDASTGAHVWAETYNRAFSPDSGFELQDELVPRIVSTVADWYGVLPHSMSEAVRLKSPDQLSPYEAVLRSFGYFERIAPEEHAAVRAGLERAVEQSPGNADGWAMLSMMYGEEHRFGFNVQPDPLGRSLQAARRAVDAGHANHFAWLALAQALFFRKEFDVFRDAAERAIALNPMDGSTVEYLGHLIAFSGEWDLGCELAERARQLNPNHPGWYWAVLFLDAYRKGDYRNARTFILKSNQPGHFFTQALVAAVHGQLGEREEADKALRVVLTLKPEFPLIARDEFGKWYLPELVEQLMDGLRKAGLEIADQQRPAAPLPVTGATDTGTVADSGGRPGIAVLPFANLSADSDQEYFSDGLAEEIINLLAQVRGLKVIARTSAFAFRGKEQDIREIAGALGVTTVLQGSVRRAGSRLRVSAQLIDAADGAHLWAERFDREMTEVFAVQDEIAAAIASALRLTLIGQPSQARLYEPNFQAYEAFLRGRHQYYKFSPEAFTRAEQEFIRAIALEPEWAEPHAALADVYFALGFYGWRPLDDVVQLARAEAQKAVAILSSHPMAHAVLAAIAALRDYDWQEAEAQFGQATASGELDPNGRMLCAMFYLLAAGRFDEAAREMSLAITQDPLNAFWRARQAWILLCGGRYDEAIAEARKALEFDDTNYQARMMVALSLTFQRKLPEARKEAEEVFRLAPWDALGTGLLAGLLAQTGERDRASRLIPTITSSGAAPVGMMMYHLVCAEIDAAIDWYQKDIELRRPNAPMIAFAGFLSPLRAHHRWPKIARMMNLPYREGETMILAPSPPVQSGSARHTVGRTPERDELRAAFNAAKAGRGSILCIAGEPGIGKTTLIEDFLAELSTDDNITIARGRCSERLAGTEAYLPLLDALENLLQSGESMAPTMKQLAPTWYAQVVPLSGESDESARLLAEVKAASQERMKRELAAFLQSVVQARPLVIFFDDLHWADVSTIDLLSFLAGKFDGLRALIVVTYRPSDMLLAKHPFLQIKPDLQARGVCRELLLEFLNESEIADYLILEFPGHRFPSEFPKLIHAKTEGSPLFMADLVRYLRDRNVIAQTSGTWMLASGLPDIERELPESVRGMIERKITQLSEEDHKLLTVASVQGYEFDSAVVAQVLSLDADKIEERLEKLERVFAFVKLTSETEFPNRTLTMRYRFIHVLYQNALYTSLRATRRATLSREVAQTIEGFYGERKASVANELAALYETGREFAKAADYFHLAAEHARQVFAEQEAAALAGRGLEALKSLPDTPERAHQELALQVILGLALRTIKGFSNPETGKAYLRARELCEQIGDTPQLFPVLFGLWEFDQSTAQLETAIELAQLLLAAAGEDESLRLVAHNVMADQLTWVGRFVDAREHLEQGIALYDSDKHSSNVFTYGYDSGVACLGFGSIVLWHLGYADQALKMSDQARDLAAKLPHPLNLAFAASFAAWFHSLVGSMQTAQKQAEAAIAISEQYDIAMFLAWGKLVKGWAIVSQGDIEVGIALSNQGIDEWRASGTLLASSWCLGILAEGNKKAGRRDESLALLTEALDFASRSGEHFYEAELHRLRGELLLESDDGDSALEAEQCFDRAIDIARQQSAKSFELRASMSLARLWLQQDKRVEAHQMLAEIYGWFTEGFDTTDLRNAKALLDELSVDPEK